MAAPGQDLTERQKEVLRFICRTWLLERGATPSARSLARALGRKSSNPQAFLRPLVRKGYITTVKGEARNIRITDLGIQWYEYEANRDPAQPELDLVVVEPAIAEQVEMLLLP